MDLVLSSEWENNLWRVFLLVARNPVTLWMVLLVVAFSFFPTILGVCRDLLMLFGHSTCMTAGSVMVSVVGILRGDEDTQTYRNQKLLNLFQPQVEGMQKRLTCTLAPQPTPAGIPCVCLRPSHLVKLSLFYWIWSAFTIYVSGFLHKMVQHICFIFTRPISKPLVCKVKVEI